MKEPVDKGFNDLFWGFGNISLLMMLPKYEQMYYNRQYKDEF